MALHNDMVSFAGKYRKSANLQCKHLANLPILHMNLSLLVKSVGKCLEFG